MKRFFEIGIGLVGAVQFNFQDQRGIVLYFARYSVKVELLRSAANERYMMGSTDLIGANYAIRKARAESSELRKNILREAVKKVKKELIGKKKSRVSLRSSHNWM